MKDSIDVSSAAYNGERKPGMISELAIRVVTRMAEQEGAPSMAMLVACLAEAQDQLPEAFDEQIYLLEALGWSSEIYLKKPGIESFVYELERFITNLELCGELPCYSFQTMFERLQKLSDFAARRYLQGLKGLGSRDGSINTEHRLLALLDRSGVGIVPFEWSEEEWKDFAALVQLGQTGVDRLQDRPATQTGSNGAARRDQAARQRQA